MEIDTSDVFGVTLLSLNQIKDFINLMHTIFSNKESNELLKNVDEYIVWMKKGISQLFNIFLNKKSSLDCEKDFYDNCDKLIDIISKNNKKF